MIRVEDMIRELPGELQDEVRDFVQFLLDRRVRRKQAKLRLSWAGGLTEFREQYTALELQKRALGWWAGEVPR
ncbi:MAG: DUF2281 domain-containing protein [Deltaproteobacteria bacterium]|nr:DUF2281 domain-containing protein [Deltaproteobacteria bacterium]